MGRIFSVFLFVLGAVLVVFGAVKIAGGDTSLLSPLPFMEVKAESKQFVANTWFPKQENVLGARDNELSVSATSAILVDYDTGNVLFAKGQDKRLPVASTVKIMTALLALEQKGLSDELIVSEKAAKVGENSMMLTAGEKLTVSELLYGMMLVSGNDAAVTIAESVDGSEEKFVERMNARAKELGMKNTKFVNASGLDVDGQAQYSSVYDMAVLARYAWETQPKLRDISSTYHYYIEASSTHKDFEFYNDTNLLTTYPGVKGIKPGFTWEAGLCLVTYVENDGKKLIGVILGSFDRRGEMKELLDYGFSKYGIHVSHPALDL